MSISYEPIREDTPNPDGRHPYAKLPIHAFEQIVATCDDCGRSRVLGIDDIDGLGAVQNFAQLWRHAFCAHCREEGGSGKRVTLEGKLRDTPVENREPVFDPPRRGVRDTLSADWEEKRARLRQARAGSVDLPRRSLFRDRGPGGTA